MNPLLVKHKLGKTVKVLICPVVLTPGELGKTPWHGPAWEGIKKFSANDPYQFDTELPEIPYAGPGFTWKVRCPVDAWHFCFSVFDQNDNLVLRAVEFSNQLIEKPGTINYTDLELDLYQLPDGTVLVVDQDEFESAIQSGLMTEDQGNAIRHECAALEKAIAAGDYPWPN